MIKLCIYAKLVAKDKYLVYRLDNVARKDIKVGYSFEEEELYGIAADCEANLVLTLGDLL